MPQLLVQVLGLRSTFQCTKGNFDLGHVQQTLLCMGSRHPAIPGKFVRWMAVPSRAAKSPAL